MPLGLGFVMNNCTDFLDSLLLNGLLNSLRERSTLRLDNHLKVGIDRPGLTGLSVQSESMVKPTTSSFAFLDCIVEDGSTSI